MRQTATRKRWGSRSRPETICWTFSETPERWEKRPAWTRTRTRLCDSTAWAPAHGSLKKETQKAIEALGVFEDSGIFKGAFDEACYPRMLTLTKGLSLGKRVLLLLVVRS